MEAHGGRWKDPAEDLPAQRSEREPAGRSRWVAVLRSGPWLPALAFVAATLFVGFGLEAVLGRAVWYSPKDLWLSFRGAQYLVWGDYAQGLRYVSAPGTAVLLAPPAFVAYHLGRVAAFPFPLPKPPAWVVLAPYIAAVGSSIVFGVHSLGSALGIQRGRQSLLDWLTVPFAVPVVALWGHPEDVVALAVTMVGASAAIRGRWRHAGWLFGFACALQPLVLLFIFPLMALATPRRWLGILVRTAVPTALLMAVPVVSTGGDVVRFMQEPNWIHPNFPTPLLWLSPSAGHDLVSAAPERALAVLIAAVIGLLAWRRQVSPLGAIWCGALAMAVRVAVEPVLTPYYLWPMVALILVVIAAAPDWWALGPVVTVSVLSYFHREPWLYWAPIVLLSVVAVVATGRALPAPAADRSVAPGEAVGEKGSGAGARSGGGPAPAAVGRREAIPPAAIPSA